MSVLHDGPILRRWVVGNIYLEKEESENHGSSRLVSCLGLDLYADRRVFFTLNRQDAFLHASMPAPSGKKKRNRKT